MTQAGSMPLGQSQKEVPCPDHCTLHLCPPDAGMAQKFSITLLPVKCIHFKTLNSYLNLKGTNAIISQTKREGFAMGSPNSLFELTLRGMYLILGTAPTLPYSREQSGRPFMLLKEAQKITF